MAPRTDRFSVRRQAALLGLSDVAEKQISNLTRQYVFEKINYQSANYASLTDRDILSFAEAFVASHSSWLQQNRQPWRDGDGARLSEDREEDITVINRMMQLQSQGQKSKVAEMNKLSPDRPIGAPVARQTRNRPKRRRRRSSTPDHESIFSLSSSEDEDTRVLKRWTEDCKGGGRKSRRLHQWSSVADDDFDVMSDKDDHTAPAASQHSATDDKINFGPRSGVSNVAHTGDRRKGLYQSLGGTTAATPTDATAQQPADRTPYTRADASVQTGSVYCSVSTQNDAPSLQDRSAQTASNALTYSSIQTLANETPAPSSTDPAEGDNKIMIVETDYYEAQVYLSLWQEEAGALTRQQSESIDRYKRTQLRKVKDRLDFVVGFMSHLAQGGEVKLRLREEWK